MLAITHLADVRALVKEIGKQAQLIRMKEAVIQSQGKTILKMRQDNEALRLELNRANVCVAVEASLRAIRER